MKAKFPILSKVIILGIGVSILTAGTAITLTYFNQKNNAENNLHSNIDYTLDAVDYIFSGGTNDNNYIYNDYLTNLRNYIETTFDADTDKRSQSDFDTFQEFAQFYAEKYPWMYQRDSRMGFLTKEEADFKVGLYSLINLLNNFQTTSASQSVFFSYINNNNEMVFLVDSRMYDSNRGPNDYYHVPGYSYQIQESDYFDDSHHKNHRGYILDGYMTMFTPIYSIPLNENEQPKIIASLYIQYDLGAINSNLQETLRNESIILGFSSLALIGIYTIFSYLLFVRNINKLSKSSIEIERKLNDKNMNEIIEIPMRSHDEMAGLAQSFLNMEKAIINYVDIIHAEAQEKERTNAELSIASKIQLDSLPADSFVDKNINIKTYIKAAKEVGGDFYDYFYLDDHRLAVLISDVSGKGIPASLFMMRNKELLKSSLMSCASLKDAIKNVNDMLTKNNNELLFLTSFIGIIDFNKNEIRYINAGHEKPYIVGPNGVYKLDGESNIVLGIEENYPFIEESHPFNKGEYIFMFTDGLNESINHEFEEFGYQRIEQILEQNQGISIDNVISNMNKTLNEFVSGEEQFDDVTILIAKYQDDELKLHYEKKDYEIITDIVDKFNQSYSYLDDKIKASGGIVIDELINNLISYEEREDLIIDIKFQALNDGLKITIISNGGDYNPFANHKEKYLKEFDSEIAEGGFGLSIVKEFAKSYSYKYENKHSIIEIIL